jgi:hypothetical protein
MNIVTRSPAEHCSLDPALTWQVKRNVLKHAIVLLRLKEPALDPAELSSYRPISNQSLISKTVERVVAARFFEHVEAERLLPSHQSAYRANYSTKTAITAVHMTISYSTSSPARSPSSHYSTSALHSIRSTTIHR